MTNQHSDLVERLKGIKCLSGDTQVAIDEAIAALSERSETPPVLPEDVQSILGELNYEASIGGILEGNAADLIERLAREKEHQSRVYSKSASRLSEQIEDHKLQAEQMQARIDELEEEVRDLNYMEEGVSTKYGEAGVQINLLRARIDELERDNSGLKMINTELEKDKVELQARIDEVEGELKEFYRLIGYSPSRPNQSETGG